MKLVALVTTLVLLASVGMVQAAGTVRFADVPETYWGYRTIMDMAKAGLFKGTTEPVNGIGTFEPEKTMTRAEFLTAALRAVYPEAAANVQNVPGQWWLGYYHQALKYGLLFPSELENGAMNSPMTREEMAMLMVRCVERMGEKIEQKVDESQIADYWSISNSYKEYVRTCFSFGLLGGVDQKGTFAPHKSLTRAEAATVLCRLLDKDMRLKVEFLKENTNTGSSSGNNTGGGLNHGSNTGSNSGSNSGANSGSNPNPNPGSGSAGSGTTNPSKPPEMQEEYPEMPGTENRGPMPWEEGGKQPSAYTWDEFRALSPSEQEAFFEWFGTADAFEKWSDAVQGKEEMPSDALPWEEDGKAPSDYTWDEFCRLSAGAQEAFFNWFDSADAFEAWMNAVQSGGTSEENYPWEEGGKQPSDYTWDEFEDLSAEAQEAFFNWFDDEADFEAWMHAAQGGGDTSAESFPWEEEGRLPSDYTWDEFLALESTDQEAFFEWFDTPERFEAWMSRVQN